MLTKVMFQYKEKRPYSYITKNEKCSVLLHCNDPPLPLIVLPVLITGSHIGERFINHLLGVHPTSTTKQNR